jgi:hypothetical protein
MLHTGESKTGGDGARGKWEGAAEGDTTGGPEWPVHNAAAVDGHPNGRVPAAAAGEDAGEMAEATVGVSARGFREGSGMEWDCGNER